MRICPSCHEEFLEHIKACVHCHETLVSEEEAVSVPKKLGKLSKEDLLKSDSVALLEGNLDSCREVEFILNSAKIPCVVFPLSTQSNEDAGVLSTFSAMKYAVLVQAEKVDACKGVLQGHFRDQVAREGKGTFVEHAVDFSLGDAACPACGHVGGLEQGECTACGLFLGGER